MYKHTGTDNGHNLFYFIHLNVVHKSVVGVNRSSIVHVTYVCLMY